MKYSGRSKPVSILFSILILFPLLVTPACVGRTKKAVPLTTVASDLATLVLEWSDPSYIRKLFGDDFPNAEGIAEKTKKEWLILNMFVVTMAAMDTLDDKTVVNRLLDNMHQVIYEKTFSTRGERETFEQLVRKRYNAYYNIFASELKLHEKVDQLGIFFAKKFTGSQDVIVEYAAAKNFFTWYKFYRKFLADTFSKFEVR